MQLINSAALLTLLSFLVGMNSGSTSAETIAKYTPAALNDSRYSLQNRIKFPKFDRDFRETVICEASIDRGGRFWSNYCYTEDENESLDFARVVHNAAKGAKITPLRVNGNGHWALYQYSVDFIQHGEDRRFIVKSYQGYNNALSSSEYIAPQRILRRKWSAIPGCPLKMRVGLKVDVSATGEPSNGQFFTGEPNKVCAASILKWNSRQSYVPALSNGKAVPSIHIEYLLGPVDWRGSQVM